MFRALDGPKHLTVSRRVEYQQQPPSDVSPPKRVAVSVPEEYDDCRMGGLEEVRRSRKEALKAARRASVRSAAVVHREMKRGLDSLATIASTASWFGLLGTLIGIYNSFGAVGASKEAIIAAISENLAQALAPCALGLVAALLAMWCYRYLSSRVEVLDAEMEDMSLRLINQLTCLGQSTAI